MAVPCETFSSAAGITCLAFNGAQTEVALAHCDGDGVIYIVKCSASGDDLSTSSSAAADKSASSTAPALTPAWHVTAQLKQHDGLVSCLCWHPVSDKILSCGHDRAAYVWARQEVSRGTTLSRADVGGTAGWVPQIVVLDNSVQRGLTSCAWSPSGEKLYIGSASAVIAVGRFEPAEGWWLCRLQSRAHRCTVAALAPHPVDHTLLASGGLDGRLSFSSSLMKKVDGKLTPAAAFGTVYAVHRLRAWVTALAWSPSAQWLAACTHDSRIHLFAAAPASAAPAPVSVSVVDLFFLPLRAVAFLGESRLVAGGFNGFPVVLEALAGRDGAWELTAAGVRLRGSRGTGNRRNATRSNALREVLAEGTPWHAQAITAVVCRRGPADSTELAGCIDSFYTAGLDGALRRCWVDDLVPLRELAEKQRES